MSIRILPPQTAAKIAAGEVIIRPSSVIKELIENSVDAGADKIEAYLEAGGKSLIRICDNGSGIPVDEIELAIQRFATSKLESADDLENIRSYGFRGEALASIAEVSEMKIETQQVDAEHGICIKVKAGKVVSINQIVRTPGTTVSVKNLFFNLPARKSFLRSDAYERRLVLEVIRNYALLNNGIRYEARNKRGLLLSYLPTIQWLDRVKDVFPSLEEVELIEFAQEHKLLSVNGFVIRPDQIDKLRKLQKTFFNSRPVIYRPAYRAIIEGFGPLPGGELPFFILKLETSPDMLDVNIHPAKTEVRYRDERFLFDFLSQTIRNALHKDAVQGFDPTRIQPRISAYPGQPSSPFSPSSPSSRFPPSSFQSSSQISILDTNKDFSVSDYGLSSTRASDREIPTDATSDQNQSQPAHTGFWQLQNQYILAQVSSGLIIVDQHAAHERILYEEMLEMLDSSTVRQSLLFPLIVDLSPEEFATFEEVSDILQTMGFELKPFGPNQIIVEGLPSDARISVAELKELFAEFAETQEVKLRNRDKIAALITCKAAIKAGRSLTQEEMESLINRLFRCKTPFFCPHGRPTVIKMSMDDLDKRFGRI